MAMEVARHAHPKITAAVMAGEMSLVLAARITRLWRDPTLDFTEEVTSILKRWPLDKAPEVRALLVELTAPPQIHPRTEKITYDYDRWRAITAPLQIQ
jgi:hypothetical protein